MMRTDSSQILDCLFYTHASAEVGYGHLNRCLILADAMRAEGRTVQLIVIGGDAVRAFCQGRDYVIISEAPAEVFPCAKLCIVDRYEYADGGYNSIRETIDLIVIFDDHKHIVPASVSGVINANLEESSSPYPWGVKQFLGAQYIMLRPEFSQQTHPAERLHIFICTGASDPENQMDRYLQSVISVTADPIYAVFGPSYEWRETIEKWQAHPQVEVLIAPGNIAQIMQSSKYALTGGGSMIYELAASGTPAISLALADNQIGITEALGEANRGIGLGDFKEVTDEALKAALIKMEQSHAAFREKLHGWVDGSGAKRLAQSILNWSDLRHEGRESPFSRDEIVAEYAESAQCDEDHMRVRWATRDGMLNRYQHVMSELPFERVNSWLDVGSGTGLFQAVVQGQNPQVHAVGIELSPELLAFSLARKLPQVQFICDDFLKYNKQKFELITCLGVLAKTHMSLAAFIQHAATLLQQGGLLFLELKNRKWQRFDEPDFFPEPRHLWHDPDRVVEMLESMGVFRVEDVHGYLPHEHARVQTNASHACFIRARRA